MDYSQTLNLPRTDFPMKANLAEREPEFQAFWERIRLYEKSLERPAPKGTFILHDGPPYSNGDIHMGHALNKILKDFIVKFKSMDGYRAPYVPGWDNHGMPIENNVAEEFRKKKLRPTRLELRARCREYAGEWVEIQRREFRRLGVRGDWEHPYLTMSPDYEAKIVEVFAELANAGFIYRGLKPIHWCPRDETALAEAEIEYNDKTSFSIYVRFPLLEDPNGVFPAGTASNYTIIWTTTPWTIPANLAVAVHPDFTYAVVEAGEDRYLLAEALVKPTMEAIGVADYRVLATRPGRELMGLKFRHPLFDRPSPVVLARYVTLESGTGVVHTAPGHGREDFMTGQEYGLGILSPVDASGHFTEEAGPFAGLDLKNGDRAVIDALRDAGVLLAEGTLTHSYPHCWRCHGALIFRATDQWFMDIDHEGFREKALAAIQNVRWYPPESINRITSMVANRPDWTLSRQRAWGVGIPAFYCSSCGEAVLTPASMEAVHQLVKAEGADAWFVKPPEEILPPGFTCPHCSKNDGFRKETDILDVWFDSGSSCRAVLEQRPGLRYPADVYLEGSDQHRGWFNSSLMVGIGTRGEPPYRAVITNGWMLDEAGKAQHKSWGNAIPPEQVVNRDGADVLRLWVSSVDYFEDVRQGPNILKQVSESYRRIRNTFRYLLSNLYDFDPARDTVPYGELLEIDRWALHRLAELITRVREGYEAYEFHRIYHAVHNFCAVDLSAFYLDVLKDRLYASVAEAPARRSAQTVLLILAETLARLMAPILSHTCEEVWQHLPAADRAESVQLADFPTAPAEWRDETIAGRWDQLLAVRESVNKAIEEAKEAGTVKKPQAARVVVSAPPDGYELLRRYEDQLANIFVVSQAALRNGEASEVRVTVEPAPGERCERCWLVLPCVGDHPEHPTLCDRCAAAVSA
jgi:isoleucyl-tRNA synthetase